MRYYDIKIVDQDGGLFAHFTSLVNGVTDPGALLVEIDAPVSTLNQPMQAAAITVWGVSLKQIGQASDFNLMTITVSAGMQKGLPLANPAQAGVILQGTIQQAYGNWVDTAQWVRFIVTPGLVKNHEALNITVNWTKGQDMATAVKNTLQTALPSSTVTVNIKPELVLTADEQGYFKTLTQFAEWARDVSLEIINDPNYSGVSILLRQDNFVVSDNSVPGLPVTLAFTDLVGQPTWIGPGVVQVLVVMRADLQPTDEIILPKTQITTAPANPLVGVQDSSIFQGRFLINQMRHVGNFRQPDALAWVTTMDCQPQPNVPA